MYSVNLNEALQAASEYYQNGYHGQAEALCREIIRTHPENRDAYFILGNIFQGRNQFEASGRCYEEIIRNDPYHFGARFQLGISLYNRRRLDEAAANFEAALRLNPQSEEAYCSLGMIFREQGQFDRAIDYFRRAIELNPDSAWAYTNLGVAMQHRGEYEEGKRLLDISLAKNPSMQNTARYGGMLSERLSRQKQKPGKILIVVPVFNRKKITALALDQMMRYKAGYCHVQVYNDHSSEYDNAFLVEHADEVIQLPEKMGIDRLRWYQFRKFLQTDFDCLYMTDGDVIHDPGYIALLEELYLAGEQQLPVSLFHSIFTMQPGMILYYKKGLFLKSSAPGNSMFFDRKMVEKILVTLEKTSGVLDYLPWDNKAIACLRLPWITPEQSYLEHFGAAGVNNDNYERDRAINLTGYLRERREPILKYLTGGEDLSIDW